MSGKVPAVNETSLKYASQNNSMKKRNPFIKTTLWYLKTMKQTEPNMKLDYFADFLAFKKA